MDFYFELSAEDQFKFSKELNMEKWLGPAFKELANTNRLSDCRFIIEAADGSKQIFECHKLIFSCASNAFECMFYGGFLESKSNEIILKDVRPDIFAKFREYIYNYDIKLLKGYDETTLIDLAKFAQQYLVTAVTKDCCEILCDRTGTADIAVLIQLYQFGNDIFQVDLVQEAWENITFRFHKSMNHGAIYELSRDVFFKYIVMCKKVLKEAMRFKMIDTYLKVNKYKMSEVITMPNDDDIHQGDQGDQGDLKNTVKDYEDNTFFKSFYSFFDTAEKDDKEFKRKERIKRIKNKKDNENVQFTNVKNSYMKKLLELIEYKKMTPQEFYDGPGKTGYFDMKEKYKMLYQTTLPKEPHVQFKFK